MRKLMAKTSTFAGETEAIGREIARGLKAGDLIGLYGPVGAGKTTFVKGLAIGLNCRVPAKSPSFSLVNEYPGDIPLFHIDFYRLKTDAEIDDLGWTDYLDSDGIVVIEWADRAKNTLPSRTIDVYFTILDANSRRLEIFVNDDFGDR
jgi:tRNA threonylcarbamoyladenosine biosynthesis protein TsaE